MCPLCIGTATLLISGTTSVSGIALVLFRKHLPKHRTGASTPVPAAAENASATRNEIGDRVTGGFSRPRRKLRS